MHKKRIAMAAIFLLAAAFPAAAQSIDPQPKVVVPERIKNFGTVVEGQEVVKEFAIRNEGSTDLIIERVGTG